MKAIQIVNPGRDSRCVWTDHPMPICGAEDVIIRVEATSLNRADLLQRRGLYPPPEGTTEILGLECAGRIVEVGIAVTSLKAGERVCALLAGGGYAEYVSAPYRAVMVLPDRLSWEEGAAIPEAFLTAYLNLVVLGHMVPGSDVLIYSGGSGIGTAAIQLGVLWRAAVIATVGDEVKAQRCMSLGARRVINHYEEDIRRRVMEGTNHRGVDLILDTVGAAHLDTNLHVLRPGGRLLLIGLLGGGRTEIDLQAVLTRNIQIIGSTLRPKTAVEKGVLVEAFARDVLPHFAAGELTAVVDAVFDIRDVEEAHRRMAANLNTGKIVLRIPHGS